MLSCLNFAVMHDGEEITTIEGLGVIGTAPSTAGAASLAAAVSAAATVAARAGTYAAITLAATELPAVNMNRRRFGCSDPGKRSLFSIWIDPTRSRNCYSVDRLSDSHTQGPRAQRQSPA